MSSDDPTLSRLEAEVRPLLTALRGALTDLFAVPLRDTVGHFLATAPVVPCVRLADTWAAARADGLPTDRLLARFDPEDQFLIEIVTGVYGPTPSSPDVPRFDPLWDELAAAG